MENGERVHKKRHYGELTSIQIGVLGGEKNGREVQHSLEKSQTHNIKRATC